MGKRKSQGVAGGGISKGVIQKSSPPPLQQQACASHQSTSVLESAPACYRAPKTLWPDPDFPRKIPPKKKRPPPPGVKCWTPGIDPEKYPEKYPKKNTPKIPERPVLGIFSVFFSGYFLGVPEFRPGGGVFFFSVFLVEIPGRGHLGAL